MLLGMSPSWFPGPRPVVTRKKLLIASFVFGVAISVNAQPNINISQRPFNQAETTIVVNRADPSNLIAASNDLDGTDKDLTWYSFDGGATWTLSLIPNPAGCTGIGDPSLVFDRLGNAYYSHLVVCGLSRQEVASAFSADGGVTWTAARITTTGGTDKNFFGVGPDVNDLNRDRIYVGYQRSGVQYVQSTIDGVNWSSPPVRVSDPGNDGINIQLAVDDVGTVYAAWQEIVPDGDLSGYGFSNIFFDLSFDGGMMWGADSIAYTSNVAAFRDPFIGSSCGTQYCVPAAPDRGVGAFLALEADRSGGPFNGRLYMSVVDQGDLDGDPDANNAADHDDTDVFILYSDNQGVTWSGPIRVNDDNTNNSQFLPWLDVDQVNGGIAVGWYDARNDDGLGGPGDTNFIANDDTQYFVAVSCDGGDTFLPNQQFSQGTSSQLGADVSRGDFDFGEYSGVAMHGSIVHAAWADNSDSTGDNPSGALGTFDVYTASLFINCPPICDANGPYVAECGFDIPLDGTGSTDPNGDSLSFLWTGPFSGDTATGSEPLVNFPAPTGDKLVSLEVDDGTTTASCDAGVAVIDTTPPVIYKLTASPHELWPPNHKLVPVKIWANATDICDGADVACRITAVENSEPMKPRRHGKPEPDSLITGDLEVSLKAERKHKGNGRVYIIHVECTDTSGNISVDFVTVTVPGDKKPTHTRRGKVGKKTRGKSKKSARPRGGSDDYMKPAGRAGENNYQYNEFASV